MEIKAMTDKTVTFGTMDEFYGPRAVRALAVAAAHYAEAGNIAEANEFIATYNVLAPQVYGADQFRPLPLHEAPKMQAAIYSRNEPLDAVAAKGLCRFISLANTFFGGKKSESYMSSTYDCPTWGSVLALATESIKRTRDQHHCYLEGITKTGEVDGVTIYKFAFGS
jgi:hypothetical protein